MSGKTHVNSPIRKSRHRHHSPHHHHCRDTVDSNAGLEAWTKVYESEYFSDEQAHECLIKFSSKILSSKSEKLKILLPLCGESYDLKYLADLGHEVVGVEFVELAARKFFDLNKIPFQVNDIPSVRGKLYQSTEDKLSVRIYVCDIFNFNPDNGLVFDVVWDCGAMHSLPRKDMKKYVSIIKPLMNKPCPYLVEFTIPNCTGGKVSKKDLEEIFGQGYQVEFLGSLDTKRDYYKRWSITGFNTFLIQNK